MNDIDDWLNSIGLDTTTHNAAQNLANYNGNVPPESEPATDSLSVEDVDEILAENGFAVTEERFDEAEEVLEEDGDGTNDSTQVNSVPVPAHTVRDLDAEEDEEWQEAIDNGSITSVETPDNQVHFHMPDGQTIDVPIIHEEAAQAVDESDLERFNEVLQENNDAPTVSELLIPLNSPTLLRNDSTSRFSGAEWYSAIQKTRIILAGLGGIGSWVCLQLARMNPEALVLYDNDTVESVNMAGQLYCTSDIGRPKVDAMASMIRSYTTTRGIFAVPEKFKESTEAGDIMICGFDNMEARKTFFRSWYRHVMDKPEEERGNCLYLDGRLSIDTLQVLCIAGNDYFNMGRYRNKYLFSSAEAEHTQCSMKQTTYLACMIGSVIVNLFTNWVANSLNPLIPYDLPFFTEYDAKNMIFKTIK